MAYSNAIFYLDLVNGSDTARTTFAPTAYADNGSGLVRVTKTAHGLVTDAVIDITGTTSSVYNGAWKITKVDADKFDLQGSTYSVNPAAKGTVAPRGGSSWADAWKTLNNGATASRIAPGDTIRTAKTADPTSIGNATWTNKSATVTLASALTTNLYLDGAWTAANSASATTNTSAYKQGSNSSQITTPASTTTATKYAYYATGTLDLSSYDAITFWFWNNTTAVADANRYTIKLCSDTTGDTAVDEFSIPAVASTGRWVPFTLTRNGGGNLGASIQSIALYTGSSTPGNSQVVYLDNILACSSTGLNLTSLISKSGDGYTLNETWHGLQSINGTTVILGNSNDLNAGSTNLRGYYTKGTAVETVTTYVRPTFKLTITANTPAQPLQANGTAGNLITYSGGWNTSSNLQDGITWLDCGNGGSPALAGSSSGNVYWKVERFGTCRANTGIWMGTSTNGVVDNCIITNSTEFQIPQTCIGTNFMHCNSASSTNNNYVNYDNFICVNSRNISLTFSKGGSIYIWNSVLAILYGSRINYLEFLDNSDAINSNANGTNYVGSVYINEAVIKNNTASTGVFNSIVPMIINKLTSSGNTSTAGRSSLLVKQTTAAPQIIDLPGSGMNTQTPSTMYSNIAGDPTDNRSYWSYGNAISQTTTRHTASGIAWQINVTNTLQTSDLPALYPIAKVAVNASSLVTVKAWVKLSHATDIGAKLLVMANEIPGITTDVTATKTADTNWEELTITFTPTTKGVVQVYLAAYWLANTANQSVYVDDITVTQA